MDRVGGEPGESPFDMVQRFYEEEYNVPTLPEDRTGGLRFRKGVPDALLHLGRNNISALERLSVQLEQEKRRSVGAAGNLSASGSRAALASLLYWHAPDIPIWLIGESLGYESARVRALAEKNPTVVIRCLDCDAPIQPKGRWHFQEMLRAVEEFHQNPQLLRQYLYTGLHCEGCTLERRQVGRGVGQARARTPGTATRTALFALQGVFADFPLAA